jgi:tRNA threonylcarbamoyladenosine biosynthesis protein TsaE
MTLVTREPRETQALGRRLGRLLRGLDVICLYGDLGSGKTTMTKGIAWGTGFRGAVTSPTFGLARVYRGKRLTLNHLDLYRIAADETGDVGIEDYLHDPRAACIIEWPAAGAAYYPKDRLEVQLNHAEGGRRLAFKALGNRSRELLASLRTARA